MLRSAAVRILVVALARAGVNAATVTALADPGAGATAFVAVTPTRVRAAVGWFGVTTTTP